MATLREWLNKADFDWDSGVIVYHELRTIDDDGYFVTRPPGWADLIDVGSKKVIAHDHVVLDHNFECGHGGPECPRIVAKDRDRVYFPSKYDGATWLQVVELDLDKYLDGDKETPYPGGG